mgnify:CR=1 FL=1
MKIKLYSIVLVHLIAFAFSVQADEYDPKLETLVITPAYDQLKANDPTRVDTYITLQDKTVIPQNLTDFISSSPSVSQNGQGGHFQNFSIRGLSKHRVKTLINDISIQGVRRAGASVSFIDPLLIGGVTIQRNPASTLFGSGALGGVVQVETNHFTTPTVMTGYNSEADENYQVLATGQQNWSFGIAKREAQNSNSTNDNSELNTHFEQYSATFSATTKLQGLNLDFFALQSLAKDVGKSNTSFPDRRTHYPEENHLLAKLGIRSDSGWQAKIYIHPNALQTEVLTVNSSLNTVSNQAFDYGSRWSFEQQWGEVNSLFGIDYSARHAVETKESAVDLSTYSSTLYTPLQDGEEHETSVFSTIDWQIGQAELQAGTRFSYFQQSARHISSQQDSAWSGFINMLYPFDNGIDFSANASTAYRYPTLSERLFTGTTGRGNVISNPDLEKEQSYNIDLGLGLVREHYSIASHLYYLRIHDYIERIELGNDVLTFANLNNGLITGFELEGNHFINDNWQFNWSGHIIRGEDDKGAALSDIPSNRIVLSVAHQQGKWESLIDFEYRTHKKNPGSGEKEIPSVGLLSTAIRYQAMPNLQLSFSAKNLFDAEYFSSADRKADYAQGRSFGINLIWTMT